MVRKTTTPSRLPALGAATVGAGAAVTAAIAGACCVGPALAPVFLSILGAGGLIAVSGLRPYTPWLLLLSALMLAFSIRQLFRKTTSAAVCEVNQTSISTRVARVMVIGAGLLWCLSAAYGIYGLLHE